MAVLERPTIMVSNQVANEGCFVDMRKIVYFLFCTLSASSAFSGEENLPCWLSGDTSGVITSKEALLKTYLLRIELSDPKGDAKKRINHGDYRLIGIGGLWLGYPALNMPKDGDILCKFGGRYIQGTSDVSGSVSYARLEAMFVKYAKVYNEVIIDYYYQKYK